MGRLKIDSLTKTYSGGDTDITAVDNFNISIDDGEFVILVGPSGCGKSTTLRSVAGLETVTEGTVEINGVDVTDREPGDRDIAMVFQNYALYPHFNVSQNISFGLKMSTDLSNEVIDQKVSDALKMLDIQDLANKQPQALSGGQQQRVALGRALVRDPAVFLMDEPLSNLDAKLRTQMRTRLQDLQHELGVTTVYVTHDQTEAMTMGDRIVVMNSGKIQQIAPPLECYYEPENKFVASFIGSPSMNFSDVSVSEGVLSADVFNYSVSPALRPTVERYDRLTIGIRPEDIEMPDSKTDQAIPTTVRTVEPIGDITHVTVDIGDQQWNLTTHSNIHIRPGDELPLTFDEDSLYIFETDTGKTIKYHQKVQEGEHESSIKN